jgi:tetratricopeptide (TPR) repeat protein
MKINNFLICIIILFFTPQLLFAQKIDSLHKELNKNISDELRTDIYSELSYEYTYSNIKKSKEYALKALELAKINKNTKQEADAYNHLGLAYFYGNRYKEAQGFYQKAQKLYKKINYQRGVALTYSNTGLIYESKAEYDKALEQYFKALKICEKTQSHKDISMCLNNIGNIYFFQDKFKKASEYYQKCLKIDQKIKDYHAMSVSLNNLALIYSKQGKYDSAITQHKEAMQIAIKMKDVSSEIKSLISLGRKYQMKKNYAKSLEYLNIADSKSKAYGDEYLIGNVYNSFIKFYIGMNQYDKALQKAKQFYELALKIGAKEQMLSACDNLANIYSKLNDYENAFEFKTLVQAYNDTIYNQKNAQNIQALEMERKEYENELLLKEKSLQKAKILSQKKVLEMQYLIIFSILLVLILVGTWLGFIRRGYLKEQKNNELLKNQNEKISYYSSTLEETNQELFASQQNMKSLNQNLEQKVQDRTKTLALANEKLRKYAFSNSHIVRSPLANILGLITLINLENTTDSEKQFYLNQIQKSAEELDRVIHDINQNLNQISASSQENS